MKLFSASLLTVGLVFAGHAAAQSSGYYTGQQGGYYGPGQSSDAHGTYDYARVLRVDPVIESGYSSRNARNPSQCYYRNADDVYVGNGNDYPDYRGYRGNQGYAGNDGYYERNGGYRTGGSDSGRTVATVLGGMLVKRVAVQTVLRFGYKRVLQVNSVLLGVMIAGLGLVSPAQPVWLIVAQLFVFGAINSMQFSAMNSVTLKDMTGESASSGNSLLSMVQMLAMSMGVAIAGAVLAGYADMWQAREGYKLLALQATFVTVGVMTLAATLVFSQLEPDEKVRSAPDGHD